MNGRQQSYESAKRAADRRLRTEYRKAVKEQRRLARAARRKSEGYVGVESDVMPVAGQEPST